MSSYYGGGWAVYEVEAEEQAELASQPETSRVWSHSAAAVRSLSSDPWVRTREGERGQRAEVFEMASNAWGRSPFGMVGMSRMVEMAGEFTGDTVNVVRITENKALEINLIQQNLKETIKAEVV